MGIAAAGDLRSSTWRRVHAFLPSQINTISHLLGQIAASAAVMKNVKTQLTQLVGMASLSMRTFARRVQR